MAAAGLKEEAGKQKTFRGCRAERSVDVDDGDQINVGIVEPQEEIDMGLDALRNNRLQRVIELLLDLVWIVSQGKLPPAEGFLAGHDEAEVSSDGAVIVEGDVAGADSLVVGICLLGSESDEVAAGAEADAGGLGMAPVHG